MRFFFGFSNFLEFRSHVFRALGKEPTPLLSWDIPQYLALLVKLFTIRFILSPALAFLPYWFIAVFSFSLASLGVSLYHYGFLISPLSVFDWTFLAFLNRLSDRFLLEIGDFSLIPYYLGSIFFSILKFYAHKVYAFLYVWGWPYFWWVLKWIRYYIVSWLLVIPIAKHVYVFLFGLFRGRFDPLDTILGVFFGSAFILGSIKNFQLFFLGDKRIYNSYYFYFFKYYYLVLVIYKSLPYSLRTLFYHTYKALHYLFSVLLKFFKGLFFWSLRFLVSFFPAPLFPRPLYLFPLFPITLPLRSFWSVFRFLDQSLDELSRFLTAQFFLSLDLLRLYFPSFLKSLSSFLAVLYSRFKASLPQPPRLSRLLSLYRTYYPIFIENLPRAYGWATFFLMVFRNRARLRLSQASTRLFSLLRLSPYWAAYGLIQLFTLPLEFLDFTWNDLRGFRYRSLHRSQMLMQYKFYYLLKPLFRYEYPRPQFIIRMDSPYMACLRSMTWDDNPRIPFYVLDTEINYAYVSDRRSQWNRAQLDEWDREDRLAANKPDLKDLKFRPRTHREMLHYVGACFGKEADKKKLKALLKANPPLRFPRCILPDYERYYCYFHWEPFWDWEVEELRKKTEAAIIREKAEEASGGVPKKKPKKPRKKSKS